MKRGRIGVRRTKGQIWVETVIYTLIAFAMIGLALAFIKPKIDEIQDKAIIEQSISMLEEINSVIKNIGDAGNQRVVELGIREGTLTINGTNDLLLFEITGEYAYSEPETKLEIGKILALTEQKGELYTVTLTSNYSSHNLLYDNADTERTLSKSSNPYKILISNQGNDENGKPKINFEVIN